MTSDWTTDGGMTSDWTTVGPLTHDSTAGDKPWAERDTNQELGCCPFRVWPDYTNGTTTLFYHSGVSDTRCLSFVQKTPTQLLVLD